MFNLREFIRNKFNKGEGIDDSVKNYPLVVYDNDVIRKEIYEWVKFIGAKSFRQVLLDIGFKESDVVYIHEKCSSALEYYYSVNNDKINEDNYLKISYGAFLDRGSTIDIYNGNYYRDYEFIDNNFDSDKNSFMLSIEEKELSSGSKYYIRNYYSNMACFVVKYENYEFVFDFGDLTSIDDTSAIVLDNEDKLCEYLCNLEFPIDVIDVYKNIINICNMDFSKYTFFEIKCIPDRKIANRDVLELRNGEFRELKITRDGKRICLNCNDVWEYENINDAFLVRFSMNSSNNNVGYKVRGVNDKVVDSYTLGLLKSDISVARSEIEDTKKLVRILINNR